GHDGREPLLLDESPRDLRAGVVELVRAVRRLPEQHEPRVADRVEQAAVILAGPGERPGGVTHGPRDAFRILPHDLYSRFASPICVGYRPSKATFPLSTVPAPPVPDR